MLIALFSLVLQTGPLPVRVLAKDEHGFGEVGFLTAQHPGPVVIPSVTRSEVVQRAIAVHAEVRLRLEGGVAREDVLLEAQWHTPDEQVLVLEGTPHIVGPPMLPMRARTRGGADVLPRIARRDGVGVAVGEGLVLSPPQGLGERKLVLIATTGESWIGTSEDRQENRQPLEIDQAFYAEVALRRSAGLVGWSVTDEGGCIEIALRPLPPEGKVWSLLVSLRSPPQAASPPRPPRPATVPGYLVDRADELGAAFSHLEGPDEQLDIRPTMGPGAAWGDVDGDGWQDLYLVQGDGREGSEVSTNRLLRNEDGLRFADVTDAVGGGDRGAGMGALFLDGDADGDLDLYVANYGADVLFANAPGEDLPRLVDVSAAAGIGGDKWSAGIAASDYDNDGDLDLYVTSYLVFDPALMPPLEELAYQREDPVAMLPFAFPGQANTFLKNESDARGMRFVDVTDELGLADAEGRGMQPIFFDFDRDGDDDLYVANDVSFNVMFRNEGDGTFRDVSFSTGLDDPRGGMGLATGDVDLDGDEDVFLTNWELEPNALYVNNLLRHDSQRHHVATFRDMIVRSGLGPAGIGVTSWGAELFDADNDGDLDLFVANGYTSPDYESTGICVGQPNHYFENDGTGRFTDASAKACAALARRLPSRAAVACDFDQDGDLDLVVTSNNGPVQLLCNELSASAKGRWLLVRLRGANGNTHGIGAEVTVRSGERAWRRQLRAGTSYLGGNPPELHFGLGSADGVDSIEVRWSSGAVTTHAVDGVDRVLTLAE